MVNITLSVCVCHEGLQIKNEMTQKVQFCTTRDAIFRLKVKWLKGKVTMRPSSQSLRRIMRVNPLMGTLKPQSNEPLYSNTVIGTLAVDGWAVTLGTARRGMGGLRPRLVPSSLYQM